MTDTTESVIANPSGSDLNTSRDASPIAYPSIPAKIEKEVA